MKNKIYSDLLHTATERPDLAKAFGELCYLMNGYTWVVQSEMLSAYLNGRNNAHERKAT